MNKYKLSKDLENCKKFRHNGINYDPKTITQKTLKSLYKSGFASITETKKITKNEEIEKNNGND
tara:strand:+ start:1470 stop:1661 length:192 start_codon:yes stop_codon:yes gene_type:complete